MYLWNRQFFLSPARFWEGLEAISEAVTYSNAHSDYDFDVWLPAGVGTLGAVGISSRVAEFAPFAWGCAMRSLDPPEAADRRSRNTSSPGFTRLPVASVRSTVGSFEPPRRASS